MSRFVNWRGFVAPSQSEKHTLLFVIPPFVLSVVISITVLITQLVIIYLLDSHIKGDRVHYGQHSIRIQLNRWPNASLIVTSIVGSILTVATAFGLWILRHPTQKSSQRSRLSGGITLFVSLANASLTLACAVIVFHLHPRWFNVYYNEMKDAEVYATRESWLCNLQHRDGNGVGNVQRWGSIGCRMSAADRWLSLALLALATMGFGMVVGVLLDYEKSTDGYEPVSTNDEDEG